MTPFGLVALAVGVAVTVYKAGRNTALPYRTPPGGGC